MRLETAQVLVNLFGRDGYRELREVVRQNEVEMVEKLLLVDPQNVAAVAKAQVRATYIGVVLNRIQELAESTVLEHSQTIRSMEGKPI